MIFPGATAKRNGRRAKGQAVSISTRTSRRVRPTEVQEYAVRDEVGKDDFGRVVVDLERAKAIARIESIARRDADEAATQTTLEASRTVKSSVLVTEF